MRSTTVAGLIGLAALAACSDGGPAATGRVDVGFATDASAAGASGTGALMADTYTDLSGNTLVIEGVQVVIRKLKLEGNAAVGCQDDEGGEDSLMTSSDSGEVEGGDDCAVLQTGPFLVDLPLNGGVEHQVTVTVDTGTYAEAQFQIHKPEGVEDQAFLVAHPEFAGASIRVTGTYNGTPFTFTTGVTDLQKVEFDPPVVVTEGTTSFTVLVGLSGWFKTGEGVLLDPATVAGDLALSAEVNANIVRSFHGFGDEDHDGHPDD